MAKKVAVTKVQRPAEPPAERREGLGHPLLALREQMDRLFDEFASDWHLPSFGRGLFEFEPFRTPLWGRGMVDVRFDVSESDDEIELTAELPGIDEKDIDLTLSEGLLTIKGEKKSETERKERDYYLSERRYGAFTRSVRVPDTVDENRINASFAKGILRVVLPKRPEAKAKKKKIQISKS